MTSAQVKRNWAAQEVLSRAEDTKDRSLRQNWSDQTLQGLDRKLSQFENALGSFVWPTAPPPWYESRLVTVSQDARGKVNGVVRPTGQSTPEVKVVSGGFDAWARTDLAAGTYRFDLSLGGYTETLSVAVGENDTWGDVLSGVKSAVNAAPLAARADVVYQNASYQLNPDMAGTGSVLALSVNPDRPAQDLQVADVSGSLLSSLRMTAAQYPTDAASRTEYTVTGLQKALPTFFSSTPVDPRAAATLSQGRHDLAYAVGDSAQAGAYISKAYDPTEATTVAAGTYTFDSTHDGETRSHSVTIGSGWTWGDVLRTVGAEINAQPAWAVSANPALSAPSTTYSQPGVSASVDYWPLPTAQQGVTTDGQSLQVRGESGSGFTLADTSGGLLSALGLTTRLDGTPVSFNVGSGDTWRDVFNSVATAVNGSQLYFSVQAEATRIPSTVTPGRDLWHEGVYLSIIQSGQRIGERVNLMDGRTGALDAMGILGNQRPGQDARILANGREQTSENNTFSQDRGRVLVNLEESFGEALPLSVTTGMDEVQKSWSAITDAWNGLAKYLNNNADLLDHSLGARLEAPLAAQAGNLRWLGVSSMGKSGQLWTNLDAFWGSLYADADRSRATLWDKPSGLVPAWQQVVADIRGNSLDGWLKPESAFDSLRPNLTSEFQLEQKHRLVKLLG